ncbi:MAG: proline--tRNA ligase [Anaerolineales bacterium]|nr:proline--tRNA ligase [Anaerolineales bacterium]
MSEEKLPSRSDNFSEWYNQVVLRAEMADYAPVRGCMVVRPYGWTLWENIQSALDQRFKATGHVNAAFPLLIPKSFIEKEKEHIEGFSPELAVVTIGGGEILEEPLIIRPTSETIIGHMYAKWIQSHRDLPVLINQWGNVVRWELRTRLFLRTLEFYWQEGHTAHATAEEAEQETLRMLDVYTDFAVNEAALPVIPGRKSEKERFAGAVRSYTIEAMMGDKRALQSGTSHNLGQNFAKAFNIQFLDENNQLQYAWTTSWGLSTRIIGAIIMAHGDDQGLIMPPRLAPFQAVIVPIWKTPEEKQTVLEAANNLKQILAATNIRVQLDASEQKTPGWKYNYWELKGVPIRVELGPRDIAQGTAVLARRDILGREGKINGTALDQVPERVKNLLVEIQAAMLKRATEFRDANINDVKSYADLETIIEQGGWARGWWAGTDEDELKIKEQLGITIRCFPSEQSTGPGVCFYTGKPARDIALFAKAY